jgi:short subunit dehydrogenase-like uncharacterized protein
MTVVVLGATGYTGRLLVGELVRRGAQPTLVGRSRDRLAQLAAESGGLATAVADVAQPGALADVVGAGDVLVTTVGPFALLGQPALRAALDTGAAYLDSTGEAAFVRRVFHEAEGAPSTFLTACGFDFVPGQHAGQLALEQAPAAAGLDIVYTSESSAGGSSGTRASGAVVIESPTHLRRAGRLVQQPPLREVRRFQDGSREVSTVLFGGTEPYAFPALRDCRVYLDIGAATRAARVASYALTPLLRVPAVRGLVRSALRRGTATTGQGPSAQERATSRSVILGIARDAAGTELARVRLVGPDPYDITASVMAWAALGLAEGSTPPGAQTPLSAFGPEALAQACEVAGLRQA